MEQKLSRRQFGRLGLAALATALLPLTDSPLTNYAENKEVQEISYEKDSNCNGVEYTKIKERIAKKLGNETVKVEFGLESKLWKSLKSGMNKQEFYNSIKQAPIELKTTTIFGGVTGIRGYINSDDIKCEFLSSADRFVKDKPSQYDSGLTFSKEDKLILEKMLDRELKSSLKETVKPWNPFASSKEVYVYPPQSQILLRTDKKGFPTFEMRINENGKISEEPSYEKLDVTKITEKNEKEVFRKFLLLSILTKDPEGIVPFENFYIEYEKRKE